MLRIITIYSRDLYSSIQYYKNSTYVIGISLGSEIAISLISRCNLPWNFPQSNCTLAPSVCHQTVTRPSQTVPICHQTVLTLLPNRCKLFHVHTGCSHRTNRDRTNRTQTARRPHEPHADRTQTAHRPHEPHTDRTQTARTAIPLQSNCTLALFVPLQPICTLAPFVKRYPC